MKFYLTLVIIAISLPALSQVEEWERQRKQEKAKWEAQQQKEKAAWEQERMETRQHWQDMIDRESAAWQAHVAAVRQKWKEVYFSDVKTWVGYSEDKKSRFQADFENGNLTLEIIDDAATPSEKLQEKAQQLLDDIRQEKAAGSEQALLEDQLEIDENGGLQKQELHSRPYTTPDGQQYQKITIRIPFKKDHLRKRAARVLPFVLKYSQTYNLDPKLIMAVIHTESAFNPKAISTFRKPGGGYGHAYGLMQLVPYSGGKEAYQSLGGVGQPSPALLFQPEKNIEMGVAYLAKLSRFYFKDVTNLQNKAYLITAAYNTGPGNVSRSLTGKRKVAAASRKANTMQPAALFNHLVSHLPYQETRDYIQKVWRRITLY